MKNANVPKKLKKQLPKSDPSFQTKIAILMYFTKNPSKTPVLESLICCDFQNKFSEVFNLTVYTAPMNGSFR